MLQKDVKRASNIINCIPFIDGCIEELITCWLRDKVLNYSNL